MIGQIMLKKSESISPEEAAELFYMAFPDCEVTEEYILASMGWQDDYTLAKWRNRVTAELREIS